MARPAVSKASDLPPNDGTTVREVLGYLNFSSGTPDSAFQRNLNRWQAGIGLQRTCVELRDHLLRHLERLRHEAVAFKDDRQADCVIRLAFDACLPAYRRHHSDLLFHLQDDDFRQPFFLVRLFEAVLAQGPPWDEADRVVAGVLDTLNDFLGYRPLALLENEQTMEPYPHERLRPIPLYIRDAGAAAGKYESLIQRTINFFRETPSDILNDAYFDLSHLDELALDVRAHDHMHPVNKRTNYMFGEWDPHQIDNKGVYRRFVVRQITLESLLEWMHLQDEIDSDEVLFDASAVLCGTMLMASSISGFGPGTFDSNATLTSLLPKVARQRDAFYARLLQQAEGTRAKRLRQQAEKTQQPFGHVRQWLNIKLAEYGARQVQFWQLALLFARMGYPEASQAQAARIPSVSARFECEITRRLTAARLSLGRNELESAMTCLTQIDDHFKRGIECGGVVDPWSILGFQGQFPLFSSREDSVPDHRVETLLELVDRRFDVYSQAMAEAAAQGNDALVEKFSDRMFHIADAWDRYATTAVEDLPKVAGLERWKSARQVARALAEWRIAGEKSGAISFWRQHVDRFRSAEAYAQVVGMLLVKQDHVAAMGLMMQWLSEAEEVGLETATDSLDSLLVRWMKLVTGFGGEPTAQDDWWPTIRRCFDYLEANAGDLWSVPRFDAISEMLTLFDEEALDELEDLPEDQFDDEFSDEEDNLFHAAYDNVVFRESARDGIDDDILDGSHLSFNSEFESIARHLDPRLRFLRTLARLWQVVAAAIASQPSDDEHSAEDAAIHGREERTEVLDSWYRRTERLQAGLSDLAKAVWSYQISLPGGDHDSNIEYDLELQTKLFLLHTIIGTHVDLCAAQRLLRCTIPSKQISGEAADDERLLVDIYRRILRRDIVAVRRLLPKLLERISKRPLLYVPLEAGGRPEPMQAARTLQSVLRFLLSQLPQLGMLRETWHVLRTAYRMERTSRLSGPAVTEFDRLFQTALSNTLDCVIRSSAEWKSGRFTSDDLIEIVGDLVERYLALWLKHSSSMRLCNVEMLNDEVVWEDVKQFIGTYGDELFHARMMTLGNVRAILHNGVDQFLDHLSENQDPLTPNRLLEDLSRGSIDIDQVSRCLELIYESVVDKFDRFVDYNTTTTQSDYGENFYCLLDFLRVEADYERDDWNLAPISFAHNLLVGFGKDDAARKWEEAFRLRTSEIADTYVARLSELEETYGMRLPAIRNRLGERFVKPLAVNRMRALVPRAVEDARARKQAPNSFASLSAEIEGYLDTTAGSAIDVPAWLVNLEEEIERVDDDSSRGGEKELEIRLPKLVIGLREIRRQLKIWNQRPGKKRPSE
jgi:hypothetical protein